MRFPVSTNHISRISMGSPCCYQRGGNPGYASKRTCSRVYCVFPPSSSPAFKQPFVRAWKVTVPSRVRYRKFLSHVVLRTHACFLVSFGLSHFFQNDKCVWVLFATFRDSSCQKRPENNSKKYQKFGRTNKKSSICSKY